MSENETYQVVAECTNCGRVPKRTTSEGKAIEPFQYEIPKGTSVRMFFVNKDCPNCGCATLKRQFS